jgi:hypothetical protein
MLPMFLMVIFGIIILGMGVFYQQQVTNAAREAARYAVIHSASAACPTVSWLDPDPAAAPRGYYRCEGPENGWPGMVEAARSAVFGMPAAGLSVVGCWSGYWTKDSLGNWAAHDAAPWTAATPTYFRGCTIGGTDPRTNASSIACPGPATAPSDDMASDLSQSTALSANQVTLYACYKWQPPLAGFLLIPPVVDLRAVVTQGLEYQQ